MFFKVFMEYLFINKLCIHCLECPLWYPTGFSKKKKKKTAGQKYGLNRTEEKSRNLGILSILAKF